VGDPSRSRAWRRVSIVLDGPLAPALVPSLWERVETLLDGSPALVECDVAAVERPDARMIEALARLQLAARRSGCWLLIRHACGDLRGLLELMGLSDVVPCSGSDLKPRREAEQREPPGGVEEERDPLDPFP
jgi:ABC-type transporter Mla MlaB component